MTCSSNFPRFQSIHKKYRYHRLLAWLCPTFRRHWYNKMIGPSVEEMRDKFRSDIQLGESYDLLK